MDFDVIISCCAKSGSTSLSKTFEKKGYKTLHVHNDNQFKKYRKDLIDESSTDNLRDFILRQKTNRVVIIDVFRTPIERLVSSFFQNITKYNEYNLKDILLYNYFLSNDRSIECYNTMEDLFPEIFEKEYYHEDYFVARRDNLIFIKLKFDCIKKWDEQLSIILEEEINIIPENLSCSKDYKTLYEKFKKNFVLKRSDFEFIVDNSLLRKYCTSLQIQKYLEFWVPKIVEDSEFNSLMRISTFKNVPPNFNFETYRNFYSDLKDLDNEFDLKIHYEFYGFYEGRQTDIIEIDLKFLNSNFKCIYGCLENVINVTPTFLSLSEVHEDKIKIILKENYNDLFSDVYPNKIKTLIIINGENIIPILENTKIIFLFSR